MLLYIDRLTGDELVTDALPSKELDGGILAVESMRITVGGEEVDIGCGSEFGGAAADEGVDDTKETVLNIVQSHNLQLFSVSKSEYKALMKEFWPRIKASIEKEVNEAESDWEKDQAKTKYNNFKKNFPTLKEFVKETIVANFSDFEFYIGESNNPEGLIVPARYIGESTTPTFYFFLDALRTEKA